MSTIVKSASKKAVNTKKIGGGLVGALAMIYFYFCDDFVLAGPILAVCERWGLWAGTLFGICACFIWNVPQTLTLLAQFREDVTAESRYARAENIIMIIGWFQPTLVVSLAYGYKWGIVAAIGSVLLYRFTVLLRSRYGNQDEELGTKLEKFSNWVWKHRKFTYLFLFVIGPQMPLYPASRSNASNADLRGLAIRLLCVYSVLFTLGYTFLSWLL